MAENRTASFKGSLYREDFDLSDRGRLTCEKNSFRESSPFEFAKFSREKLSSERIAGKKETRYCENTSFTLRNERGLIVPREVTTISSADDFSSSARVAVSEGKIVDILNHIVTLLPKNPTALISKPEPFAFTAWSKRSFFSKYISTSRKDAEKFSPQTDLPQS